MVCLFVVLKGTLWVGHRTCAFIDKGFKRYTHGVDLQILILTLFLSILV